MKNIEICYPNFTKKAVTFTIDDGHADYDTKFLSIVRPAGILGTFNLCSNRLDPVMARELYRGYEIANHCKLHPYAFDDDAVYKVSDLPYDPENCDPEYIYPHPTLENMYYFERGKGRWRLITDADTYISLIDACHSELENIFGEGSVKSYVWPFFEQNSKKVKEHLKTMGYYGVRHSGEIKDSTAFDLPRDPMSWSYNATHNDLLEVMELYEGYPDDGRLKLFCFGIHSADFEKADKWGDLERFCEIYGHRAEEFWYATVGEIFNYYNNSKNLKMTEDKLTNPTQQPISLKIDGVPTVLSCGESIYL